MKPSSVAGALTVGRRTRSAARFAWVSAARARLAPAVMTGERGCGCKIGAFVFRATASAFHRRKNGRAQALPERATRAIGEGSAARRPQAEHGRGLGIHHILL